MHYKKHVPRGRPMKANMRPRKTQAKRKRLTKDHG